MRKNLTTIEIISYFFWRYDMTPTMRQQTNFTDREHRLGRVKMLHEHIFSKAEVLN